jgi:hypothetical protein
MDKIFVWLEMDDEDEKVTEIKNEMILYNKKNTDRN